MDPGELETARFEGREALGPEIQLPRQQQLFLRRDVLALDLVGQPSPTGKDLPLESWRDGN